MRASARLVIATVAFVAVVLSGVSAAFQQAPQTGKKATTATTEAAAAAVKASPDLVNSLAKEIGSTPEQAAGAAGALFGVAKERLKADEFSKIAAAVPGMSSLLKAVPTGGGGGASNALSGLTKSAGGLGAAASAFSSLGLSPDLVAKAIPVLTGFVGKSGGADVAKLLGGALK
jgi:hypothetical protein